MSRGKKNAGPGGRNLTVRLKTARGRKSSSSRWLNRQLNDPYVVAARRDGYRSRAAYKLAELDDRFRFLRPGKRVVDLGAAPGGWTQVAVERVEAQGRGGGTVIAVDTIDVAPIAGAETMQMDITEVEVPSRIRAALGDGADVVLSDLAPPAIGHRATDHTRIVALVEAAAEIATAVLRPGGAFVAKVWQGGTEQALLAQLKRRFKSVRHAKPNASRSDSAEIYLVALDFTGDDGA